MFQYAKDRRVVVGIVLAVIGLASVYDLRTFTLLVCAIACGSLLELQELTKKSGQPLIAPLAFAASIAYLVLAMCGLLARYEGVLLAITMLAVLAWSMWGERQGYLVRSAATLLAVLYVGKLLSYFIAIRREPGAGAILTVMVIFLVACTDIFAMLIGKRFGRTKLTSISPAKTIEGACGGMAASAIIGVLFAVLCPDTHLAVWQGAFVGIFTSVAAQIGDLVESALKRDALVKDTGTALMGHGGVLDRFDSYLFGGIAFYAALYLLARLPSEYL